MLVEFPEVGVDVVAVPVERVVLHLEVVAWKVAWRVSQVVELIPEKAPVPWRWWDDLHSDGQAHGAGTCPCRFNRQLKLPLSHPFKLLGFGTDGEVEGNPAGPRPDVGGKGDRHVEMSALVVGSALGLLLNFGFSYLMG